MEPSFELSKRGRIWWASTTLPTGNVKDWTTGEFSRDEAEKKAKTWCDRVHQASRAGMKGGKMHGRHRSQRKAAVKRAADEPISRGPKPVPPKTKAAPPAPAVEAPPDPPGPAAETLKPSSAGPEGTPVDAERAASIAAKLRSLGDAPDPAYDQAAGADSAPDYIEPGAPRTDSEGQEPGENEAGDLLADIIALGIVAGTVKGVSMRCKTRKPPRKAGEPNEKMLEWYHFGVRHHLRRMIGTAGTLGPTGKLFVGCAGVIGTMLWGSEVIDPPPAAAESPRAAPPPQQANGVHRDPPAEEAPPAATSTEIVGLGRFV